MTEFTSGNVRMWSMLGSAGSFGVAALELPSLNDDTLIVTSDLRSFSGLDRFAAAHPDRLINVGIAEQNMVGVAAGLANEGFTVFATTYATFASARAADPVRVNMGYMKLPVKLVGLGTGFSVGKLGPTHMGLDDIAFMRAIPNMAVVSPADCTETVKAVIAAAAHPGPVYLRLGGDVPHPVVHRGDYSFEIGKAIELSRGADATLIATGGVVVQSIEAANQLLESGYSVGVVDMHTIKPLDEGFLAELFDRTRLVVTVEEHNIRGGLGGAVAEFKATLPSAPPQLFLGVSDFYPHAGSYAHLIEQCGLSAPQIAATVEKRLREL